MTIEIGTKQGFRWDTQGGATYKSPGLIIGGEIGADDPFEIRDGVGGQQSGYAPPVEFGASLQVQATLDTKALLLLALQSGGALTALQYEGGSSGVKFLHETAYIRRCRIAFRKGEPLACDFEFIATDETESASAGANVALTSELLPCGGTVVTIGGSPYSCQEGIIEIEQSGLQIVYDLDSKGVGSKRKPVVVIGPGIERITLSGNWLSHLPRTVAADAPALNLAAVLSATDGVNTITGTFTNLAYTGPRRMPLVAPNELVNWDFSFIGKAGSLVIT